MLYHVKKQRVTSCHALLIKEVGPKTEGALVPLATLVPILLYSPQYLKLHILHLSNGTKREVTHIGTIALHLKIVLENVLMVPNFKYNLLSVIKLLQTTNTSIFFFSSHCLLQDQQSRETLAIGKENKGLYKLEASSFISVNKTNVAHFAENSCNLWHECLGMFLITP